MFSLWGVKVLKVFTKPLLHEIWNPTLYHLSCHDSFFFNLSQSIPLGLFPISSRFLWFLKYSITAFSSKSPKEIESLPHKSLHSFATWWFKPLIFKTYIIWSNRIHNMKYLRSTTWDFKNKRIKTSEFVAKTQFTFCLSFTLACKDSFSKAFYQLLHQCFSSNLFC